MCDLVRWEVPGAALAVSPVGGDAGKFGLPGKSRGAGPSPALSPHPRLAQKNKRESDLPRHPCLSHDPDVPRAL